MLKVIGLGYPRTGTMSLKHALELLGFGPCYHMIEVFDRPDDPDFWLGALNNRNIDWEDVFRDFQSTADAPACYFSEALFQHYPQAKYILTVRDAESWYDSFLATVYQAITHPENAPDDQHRKVQAMAQTLLLDTMLEGRFEDRAAAINSYNRHNSLVRSLIPRSQLLEFEVAEGWPPLCEFLEVPIPKEPFPTSNSRAEFQERFSVEHSPMGQ